ncbi:MAG: protein translocase subunit SecF [Candidatus Pacebacteria bacterium]|nr:protein translocase subunit SecF [Candidatus Paceibacterota bacterium]
MFIIKYKKIFLILSSFLVILSMASVAFFGFNFSVDFIGGTVYEIKYTENIPKLENVKEAVKLSNIETAVVQKIGTDTFIIKAPKIPDEIKIQLNQYLTFDKKYSFKEVRSKSIGPTVSKELAQRSIYAMILVIIMIILFIAIVFKKVSKPVSSFKYGLTAIVALFHDLLIPIGIFALLGFFFISYQLDVLFVTALLAILGFSVNDTIVIFDRIRENLAKAYEKQEKEIEGEEFEKIVGKSLSQTFTRSINTSVTTLIVLLFLFLFGGESTKPFALVLICGVIAGTYSSLFIAPSILIYMEKYFKPKPKKKKTERKDGEEIDPSDITMDILKEKA